jgi:hypothetical protein
MSIEYRRFDPGEAQHRRLQDTVTRSSIGDSGRNRNGALAMFGLGLEPKST